MGRLAFIDTETTGLDPVNNEIIEIAIKIFDTEQVNWNVIRDRFELKGEYVPTEYEFEGKFKIRRMDLASPKALEINGYNEEEWKGAYSWSNTACGRLLEKLKGCVVVGHNVQFDIGFIREECRRQGLWCPRFPTLDTQGMARFLWKDFKSVSMDNIRKELPQWFDTEGSHRAMKDVNDCITIWNLFRNDGEGC
jgi:DNA polymerase-3 subunit alpha (Gram-positive type)